MSEKISFQDTDGKYVSGQYKVSDRKITVTAPDGRTRTVDIDESMRPDRLSDAAASPPERQRPATPSRESSKAVGELPVKQQPSRMVSAG